jgi:hypothetical protein
MELEGEYRIPAPPQRVWDALIDVDTLKACITGCRELERLSETEFAAIVAAKVGPVNTTFKGQVSLLDLDPPRAYTIAGQGQGGAAGFAKMRARVTLDEEEKGTLLRYSAQAEVGGKLAAVGSRLVQGVAKKNADDFFGAFAERLGGAPVTPPPAAPPALPVAGPEVAATALPALPGATTVGPAGAASVAPTAAMAGLPAWVIALIAGGCGVVLGFVLGRW